MRIDWVELNGVLHNKEDEIVEEPEGWGLEESMRVAEAGHEIDMSPGSTLFLFLSLVFDFITIMFLLL